MRSRDARHRWSFGQDDWLDCGMTRHGALLSQVSACAAIHSARGVQCLPPPTGVAGGPGGDSNVCGSMTSGGTESILTAVKASRWVPAEHQRSTLSCACHACLALLLVLMPADEACCAQCSAGVSCTEPGAVPHISYRDYMMATRGIREPEMVIAVSAHAAFVKAAGAGPCLVC